MNHFIPQLWATKCGLPCPGLNSDSDSFRLARISDLAPSCLSMYHVCTEYIFSSNAINNILCATPSFANTAPLPLSHPTTQPVGVFDLNPLDFRLAFLFSLVFGFPGSLILCQGSLLNLHKCWTLCGKCSLLPFWGARAASLARQQLPLMSR